MSNLDIGNIFGTVDPIRGRGISDLEPLNEKSNLLSSSAMRTRLSAINPTYYTSARLNSLTKNDMLFALQSLGSTPGGGGGGGGGATLGPALSLLPVGYGQPVSARSNTSHNATLTSNPKNKNFDLFFPIFDPSVAVILPYNNQFVGTAGGAPDAEGTCSLKIASYIVKADATTIPLTFGGQHFGTVGRGSVVSTDPISIGSYLRPGTDISSGTLDQGILVRTYIEVPADVSRPSSGVTSGSPTITDSGALAAWAGNHVIGTGIPTAAYVCNVVPGVSYQLASNPTTESPVLVNATVTGTPTLTLESLMPTNYNRLATIDTASADNSGEVTTGNLSGGSAGNGAYGPIGVYGGGTNAKHFGILTDSILAGISDTWTYTGPGTRSALELGLPLTKWSRGGQALSVMAKSTTRRLTAQLVPGVTDVWVELGTNDGILSSTAGFIQMRDYLLNICYWLKSLGVKRIWVYTVPPRVTTTDGYATTVNQTPLTGSTPQYLAMFNNFIRAKADPIYDYVDMAESCMSTTDSGLWKPNMTTDGVHPIASLMNGDIKDRTKASFQLARAA